MRHISINERRLLASPRSGSMKCMGPTDPPNKADCPATMKPKESNGSNIICKSPPKLRSNESSKAAIKKSTNMLAKANGLRTKRAKPSRTQRRPWMGGTLFRIKGMGGQEAR